MKKVFMVSYGGGHANIMKLLYKELKKAKDLQIVYLALTGAPYQLRNEGINIVTISDVAKRLPYYGKIISLGEQYGSQFHNTNSEISLLDTICYYGIGLYDLIMEKGEANALLAFSSLNRKAFLPVNTMMNIIKEVKPDICVITTSPRMERATAIASSRLNIPIVRINDTPFCDKIDYKCSLCVMNDWAKQFAIEHSGLGDSDIYITGQPVFENDTQLDEQEFEKIKYHVQAFKYNKIITFFTENGFYQEKELCALGEIAQNQSDTLFIIKIHPNQNMGEFQALEKSNIIIRKDQAKYYFALSDIVINAWSTTGMEAVMLGLPVIVVNFDNRDLPIDYVGMGIASLAKNKIDLEWEIKELLDKKSQLSRTLESGRKKFNFIKESTTNIYNVIMKSIS